MRMHLSHIDGAVHKLVNSGDEPLVLLGRCAPPWTAADTIFTGG